MAVWGKTSVESSVTPSAGPKLPSYRQSNYGRSPPSYPRLGLSISARATPTIGGTGGFFVAAGGNSQKLLPITACHLVFPPSKGPNNLFVRKNSSQPRVNVLLFGEHTHDGCLENIMAQIGEPGIIVRTRIGVSRTPKGATSTIEHIQDGEGQDVADVKNILQPATSRNNRPSIFTSSTPGPITPFPAVLALTTPLTYPMLPPSASC